MPIGQIFASTFSIIILICMFCDYATAAPSKDYTNICANHPPIKTSKTTNESKWNNEEKSKDRHLHFASRNARVRIASVLQGMAVDDAKEDYSKMCPGAIVNFLAGRVDVDFYGYGSKKADYVCNVAAGNTGALDCSIVHTNGYTLKAMMYPHYEERVISTTWCFEDGEVGWIIWSTNDNLTPEEDKMAMDYIKSIGFDIKDKVPMTIGSCTTKFA